MGLPLPIISAEGRLVRKSICACALCLVFLACAYATDVSLTVYEKETAYLTPRLGMRIGLESGASALEVDCFNKDFQVGLTATRRDSFSYSVQFHYSSLGNCFNTALRFGSFRKSHGFSFLVLAGPGMFTQSIDGHLIVNLSLCCEVALAYELAGLVGLELYCKTNSNISYDSQFSWFPGLKASLLLDGFSFVLEGYLKSNSFFRPPVSITEAYVGLGARMSL